MSDGEYDENYESFYEPPAAASDTMEHLKELSRAELFKMIINPDFKTESEMNLQDLKTIHVNPFSKELKVSNINEAQLGLASELTDIARNMGDLGAFKFAMMVLAFRDTMLSLSASKDGMLIKAMNTEYQFRKVETAREKIGQRWFRKNKENNSGSNY